MKLSVLILIFALAGCSTARKYKDVSEGPGEMRTVVIRTDNVDAASHTAVGEANEYCHDHGGGTAVFVKDANPNAESADLDKAKRATNVAKTVGGDANTSDVPTATSLSGLGVTGGATGGVPADQALTKTYSVEMRFTCR